MPPVNCGNNLLNANIMYMNYGDYIDEIIHI